MCKKTYLIKTLVGCCLYGLLLGGCGAKEVTLIGVNSQESDNFYEGAEESLSKDETVEESLPKYIQVYVCGAVQNPGVYAVPEGSRVEMALCASGGLLETASHSSINLADWLQDGQMVYFPTQEEVKAREEEAHAQEKGLVNINTADAQTLCTLPGIGESKASDIINYREKKGKYKKPEDIMQVPGIKENLYQKIQERIVVE